MNIVELLRTHAEATPTTPAIIDTHRGRQRVTTFAQLEAASARAAQQLQQANLHPGDAVLLFQPMSAELYIILAAIFRLGLVAMFLDPGQGRDHMAQCCALHPPKALVAGPKAHLLRLVSPALRRIPHKFIITNGRLEIGDIVPFGYLRLARSIFHWQLKIRNSQFKIRNSQFAIHHSQFIIHNSSPDTPALLTFTSGSTGQPKAALRTHGFLLAQHNALAESLQLTAGQTDLATMPIVTLANLASGVTSLIPNADLRYPGKISPEPVVAQIQSQQVSSTVASPALLEQLARYCMSNQITLPGLQKIFTGGAPVFPRLLDQLQQIAPNAAVTAVYGSTEAEPMAKIARHQIEEADMQAMLAGRGLLAGPPVGAIQLRVMQNRWGTPVGPFTCAQFESMCCPAGTAGEIVVSGRHVLPGYLHGHGNQETKFKVGDTIWHRTGDAGYLDVQGRVWLLGRCAARISDAQGKLYPFAVECAAAHQPEVRRAAVVARNGRRVLAVELYRRPTKEQLATLKTSLAWACIDEIKVLAHIPVDKRHNAKVNYPALHRLLANK